MNEKKTALEQQLGDPQLYSNREQFMKLDEQYKKVTLEAQRMNERYDAAFEAVMALEQQMS